MRVRGMRILWVSVSMLLMLSVLAVNEGASPTTTYMNVIPTMTRLSPGTLGTFKVNITITDVVDLYAWQVNMTWDPTVLNLTSHLSGSIWIAHLYFGNFLALQPGGTTKQRRVNYVKGWAEWGETSKGEIPGVDGSGWLGQAEFTILKYGSTKLDISSNYGPPTYTTFLFDSMLWDIPMTPKNGYFDNRIPGDITGPENPVGSGKYPPDRTVDGRDLIYLGANFGTSNPVADFTGPENPLGSGWYPPDGTVDGRDLILLGANFGTSV